MPVETQKYGLSLLVELYNAKKLDEGEYIRISEFNSFYDLKSLHKMAYRIKEQTIWQY